MCIKQTLGPCQNTIKISFGIKPNVLAPILQLMGISMVTNGFRWLPRTITLISRKHISQKICHSKNMYILKIKTETYVYIFTDI